MSFLSQIFSLDSIISTVAAQTTTAAAPMSAAAGAANAPSPLASLIPFVLIFIVFYFLMIRPQKKRAQQEEDMIKSLTKGDEVYTRGGILGTIIGQSEAVFTLEVSEGVKIKILKNQVAGLSKSILEAPTKK